MRAVYWRPTETLQGGPRWGRWLNGPGASLIRGDDGVRQGNRGEPVTGVRMAAHRVRYAAKHVQRVSGRSPDQVVS